MGQWRAFDSVQAATDVIMIKCQAKNKTSGDDAPEFKSLIYSSAESLCIITYVEANYVDMIVSLWLSSGCALGNSSERSPIRVLDLVICFVCLTCALSS